MDPLSITTGSLTIAKLCAQCIVSLTIWVGEVRSVDERLESFCTEIKSLSSNLEALNSTILIPDVLQAMKDVNDVAVADLWKQLQVSLDDCGKTMEQLRRILDSLKTGFGVKAGLFRKPIKQFRESLESGEISTLRERILFFTSSISLTMQMLNLAIQISGKAANKQHQGDLTNKLDALDGRVQILLRALVLRRSSAVPKDSAQPGRTRNLAMYDNMEETLKSADRFITRSRTMKTDSSSVTLKDTDDRSLFFFPDQLADVEVASIRRTFNNELSSLSVRSISMQRPEEDFDLNLELTIRYLQNGQNKYNDADWESSESCFRRALSKYATCDFKGKMALEKDDLHLMIAATCVEQKKFEDAKSLLRPLAVLKGSSNKERTFVASHVLADLYLHERDFTRAESFALLAVNGRRKLLGGKSGLYLMSVRLLILIYGQKDDRVELDAWESLLKAEKSQISSTPTIPPASTYSWRGDANFTEAVTFAVRITAICKGQGTEELLGIVQGGDQISKEVDDLSRPTEIDHAEEVDLSAASEQEATSDDLDAQKSDPIQDAEYLEVLLSPTMKPNITPAKGSLSPFQRVLGTTLTILQRQTLLDISRLISLPLETVLGVLQPLEKYFTNSIQLAAGTAVLWSDIDPSFREFILDPNRCRDAGCWINRATVHTQLFRDCIRVMKSAIHNNLVRISYDCQITDQITQKARAAIPAHVLYACENWVGHFSESRSREMAALEAYMFLENHFLHWIKVFSLLQMVPRALSQIRSLRKSAVRQPGLVFRPIIERGIKGLQDFAADAEQFIVRQEQVLLFAPLQVYRAGLVFSPTKSMIRNAFVKEIPDQLTTLPQVEETWGACSFTKFLPKSSVYMPLALSHNGQIFAYGDGEKVEVSDVESGELRLKIDKKLRSITQIAFSPAGSAEMMAITTRQFADTCIEIWHPLEGTMKSELSGHTDRISAICFSPDGRLLCSGSSDNTVRIWDLETPKCVATLLGHTKPVRHVLFSLDGLSVVSGSDDCTIRVWDVASGASQAVLVGHTAPIHSVILSQVGALMASSSKDKGIRLWKPFDGPSCAILKEDSEVSSNLAFSPDGALLASGLQKGVSLWDTTHKKKLPLSSTRPFIRGVSTLAFSHNGDLLAAAFWDTTIRIWNPKADQLVATLTGHSKTVVSFYFSPKCEHVLLSGAHDRSIKVWDLRKAGVSKPLAGHQGGLSAVSLSPDGQLLATAAEDAQVQLWSTIDGSTAMVYKGHTARPNHLVFSPDGRFLASGGLDKAIHVWDMKSKQTHAFLKDRTGTIYGIFFSLSGLTMAYHAEHGQLELWDVYKKRSKGTLPHKGRIYRMLALPGDQLLVYNFRNKNVNIWDTERRRLVRTVEFSDSVSSLQASADGRFVLSFGYRDKIQLWDTTSWQLQYTILGDPFCPRTFPRDADEPLALSPDAKYIAFINRKRTVQLYDTSTRQQVYEYQPLSVFPFRFAPDSSYFQTGFRRLSLPSLELGVTPDASCTVDDSCSWVLAGGEKLLWIPPEHRYEYHVSVRCDTIMLGHGSGHVTFLKCKWRPIPISSKAKTP